MKHIFTLAKRLFIKIGVAVGCPYLRYFPGGFLKPYLWEQIEWRKMSSSTKTKSGFRMVGSSCSWLEAIVVCFGHWEPQLTAFLVRRFQSLESGRTFIDVGANVGYFSLLAAKFMKSGKVVAIEAFPTILARLQENIKLNGMEKQVRIIPFAVSDHEGYVPFYFQCGNEGKTNSFGINMESVPVQIMGKPLKMLLTEQEIQTTRFIKMDVEGAEWLALQGVGDMWEKFPSDIEFAIEISPNLCGNEHAKAVFELFLEKGFHAYKISNEYTAAEFDRKDVITPIRIHELPVGQSDIIFSKIDAEQL